MAWSNSKCFTSWVTDVLNNTTAMDVNSDTWNNSLFDNSITPDQTVTSANSAYGAGVWASGGVSDASGWPATGRPLTGITSTFSSNVYTWDATDTSSANSSTTISGAFGCLIYDNTISTPVSHQSACFLYFGGTQSVTSGTFTVVYNAAGVVQGTF